MDFLADSAHIPHLTGVQIAFFYIGAEETKDVAPESGRELDRLGGKGRKSSPAGRQPNPLLPTLVGQPQIGPVHLALARLDEPNQDPWSIVSDEPTDLTTFDDFGLHFDIEENFLDDKSNGFQLEASRQRSEAAFERLFLVLAVATLHCTSVGVGVVRSKLRRWVDSHRDRGMSYLKIGWSWLRQQFQRGWPVMPPFWLDPAPDPEPAMASRRQAARTGPTFTVVFKC